VVTAGLSDGRARFLRWRTAVTLKGSSKRNPRLSAHCLSEAGDARLTTSLLEPNSWCPARQLGCASTTDYLVDDNKPHVAG